MLFIIYKQKFLHILRLKYPYKILIQNMLFNCSFQQYITLIHYYQL